MPNIIVGEYPYYDSKNGDFRAKFSYPYQAVKSIIQLHGFKSNSLKKNLYKCWVHFDDSFFNMDSFYFLLVGCLSVIINQTVIQSYNNTFKENWIGCRIGVWTHEIELVLLDLKRGRVHFMSLKRFNKDLNKQREKRYFEKV
ncbi:hypothetical protein EDD58_101134 [Hazenella coriacea]|uniref:Uncharacterized protein n=1 Tax=Hazenella coriacea TaxID=1179467 RepID=A0A4R3L8Y6_9BACL|nr:hypothetical protein EDD58_101134 [Hazenella coriacea]